MSLAIWGPWTLVSESHLRNLKHMSLAEEVYGRRIKGCGLGNNSTRVAQARSGLWTSESQHGVVLYPVQRAALRYEKKVEIASQQLG